MNFQYKLISSLLTLFLSLSAAATHYMGSELFYECLGGNQYRIEFHVWHGCGSIPPAATETIDIEGCSIQTTATLPLQSTTFIDLTCYSATTNCNGGSFPGLRKSVYSGVFTFPSQCVDWELTRDQCCRNGALSNLSQPNTQSQLVKAHLNNQDFPCNSSPFFLFEPILVTCVNERVCVNVGAVDAEDDSLRYSLMHGFQTTTGHINYVAPFSAAIPLATTSGIYVDSLNGDICFIPSMAQGTVLAIRVEQYDRATGQLIGWVMRDIAILVENCNNKVPVAHGFDNNTFAYGVNDQLDVCPGDNVNVTIGALEPDGDSLFFTAYNLPTGASFTDNGNGIWNLDWTPTLNQFGLNYILVELRDNNCPFEATAYATYTIDVSMDGATIQESSTLSSCSGSDGSVELVVSPLTGTLMVDWDWDGTGDFDDPAHLTGLPPGVYSYDIYDSNNPTCHATGAIEVLDSTVVYSLSYSMQDETCTGLDDGSVDVTINGPSSNPSFSLGGTVNSTGTFTGLPVGAFTIDVMEGTCDLGSITDSIGAAPAFSVTYSVDAETCVGFDDGTVTVSIAGPTTSPSFTLDGMTNTTGVFTGVPVGAFTVDVMEGSCVLPTVSDVILAATPLVIDSVLVQEGNCLNGSTPNSTMTVYASGAGTLTYQTMDTATGSVISSTSFASFVPTGGYQVIVTDGNGCQTDSYFSVQHTVPMASFILDSITGSHSAYLTNTSLDADGYEWIVNGNSIPTSDIQFSPSVNYSDSAQVCLVAFNSQGCSDTTCTMLYGTIGLLENTMAGMVAYPNPTEDILKVEGVQKGETLVLVDAQGRTVLRKVAQAELVTLDLSGLESGVYHLRGERNAVAVMVK